MKQLNSKDYYRSSFLLNKITAAFLFLFITQISAADITETDIETLIIPIQITVSNGRDVRRNMVFAQIGNNLEAEAYAGNELRTLLSGMLDSTTEAKLENHDWLTLDILKSAGLVTVYDSSLIAGEINVPPGLQPVQDISARGTRELPPYPRLEPAFLSASLPFYITAQTTRQEDSAADESSQENIYSLNLLPSLSLGNTLFFGNLNLTTQEEEIDLDRWEVSVSRDYLEYIRFTAGTSRIDTFGFQTSDPVFGFGIEAREGIGKTSVLDDRFQTSFEVETQSTADIYLNNRLIRSIRLSPGSYELSDFPLTTGENIINVVITDIYGDTRNISGSISHSPRIPAPGKTATGASSGLTGSDKDIFLARGYLRYGVLNGLGFEVYGEGVKAAQSGGINLLASGRAGFLELGGAGVIKDFSKPGDADFAARGSYNFSLSGSRQMPAFGVTAVHRTENFAPPASYTGTAVSAVPPWVINASAAQGLPKGASLLAGVRYTAGRNELPDYSSIYSYFAVPLGKQLNLRTGITSTYDGTQRTIEGIITITAFSIDKRGSLSSTWHVADNEFDAAASQSFGDSQNTSSIGVTVSRIDPQEGTVQSAAGNARAANSLAEISAAASVTPAEDPLTDTPQRISLTGRIGSGIYYADSVAAMGRPSTNSFAIISKDKSLPDGPALINPSARGAEAKTGISGKTVITSLPDYYDKPVSIELPDLPMDYSLSSTSFIIESGYRTGTVLRIEGGQLLYGSGMLLDPEGNPVQLRVLRINDSSGSMILTAFTDGSGVFYIYDLLPGEYTIVFPDSDQKAQFSLSPGQTAPFDLGDLVLSP